MSKGYFVMICSVAALIMLATALLSYKLEMSMGFTGCPVLIDSMIESLPIPVKSLDGYYY